MPEQDLKNALALAMKKHDWYYQRSDDGQKWRRGKSQSVNIHNMISELKKVIGDRETIIFWNQHCPELYRQPVPEDAP